VINTISSFNDKLNPLFVILANLHKIRNEMAKTQPSSLQILLKRRSNVKRGKESIPPFKPRLILRSNTLSNEHAINYHINNHVLIPRLLIKINKKKNKLV
jgi:hypothetical protein